MKTYKKALFLILLLTAVLLAGCGRSDVILTANEDGSFKAQVNYGITKALMGNEEVQGQVKALITDALDENSIPYTESENDEYVIISVDREFKDIKELTSPNAWSGISFVPQFSANEEPNKLWARIEDGRLKLSGVLDSAAFNASELVEQNEMASSFGGSFTVILPEAAEDAGDAEADGSTYKWSGSGSDSKTVQLVSAKMYAEAASSSEAADKAPSDKKTAEKTPAAAIIVVVVIIAAAAVVILLRKKAKKADASDNDDAAGPKED